jgi:uncharacterized protein
MPNSSPPGPNYLTLFFRLIGFIALGLVIYVGIGLMLQSSMRMNSGSSIRLLQFIGILCLYLVPAWLFCWSLGKDPLEFLKLKTYPVLLYFLAAFLLLFISEPLISFASQLNEQLSLPESMKGLEEGMRKSEQEAKKLADAMLKDHSLVALLGNLTVISLLTAIGEEVLFRGLLQQLLIRWLGRIHAGIWLSAFLFSFFHFQFFGFLPRLLMGAVLGYLFLTSRSLWTAIFFHMMNNALYILIRHFELDKSSIGIFSESYEFPWFIIVLSASLSIAVLLWLHKKNILHGNRLEESVQHH